MNNHRNMDDLDLKILRELQKDCRVSLREIANTLDTPASTVHYRVKKLEQKGVIDGYYVRINPEKINLGFFTLIRVRAKYGPEYYNKVGSRLAEIPGVWAVYFVLGETDFYLLTRSSNHSEYIDILDRIMLIEEVSRTTTEVVGKVIKEDPRFRIPASRVDQDYRESK